MKLNIAFSSTVLIAVCYFCETEAIRCYVGTGSISAGGVGVNTNIGVGGINTGVGGINTGVGGISTGVGGTEDGCYKCGKYSASVSTVLVSVDESVRYCLTEAEATTQCDSSEGVNTLNVVNVGTSCCATDLCNFASTAYISSLAAVGSLVVFILLLLWK